MNRPTKAPRSWKRWTSEEIDALKDAVKRRQPMEEILRRLPGRTRGQVYNRTSLLGLTLSGTRYHWTTKDVAVLMDEAKSLPARRVTPAIEAIAQRLGRIPSAVLAQLQYQRRKERAASRKP